MLCRERELFLLDDTLTTAYQSSKRKSDKKPFPKELRTAGKPDDPAVPKTIDGVKYWWCQVHKKWGLHSISDCRKRASYETTGNNTSSNSGGDNRASRAVRAVAAVLSQQSDSE